MIELLKQDFIVKKIEINEYNTCRARNISYRDGKEKEKEKINILLLYIRLNTQQEKKTEKKKSAIINSNQVLIPTEKTKKEGKINKI